MLFMYDTPGSFTSECVSTPRFLADPQDGVGMDAGFDFFATQNPSADALIDPVGRHWSRGEVDRLVNQTARAFRERGLARGDVIALLSRNRTEFLLTYLAA